MSPITSKRCSYLITLAATLGLAMPALANGPATKRAAGGKRPSASAATNSRALKATTTARPVVKSQAVWETSWEAPLGKTGVTLLAKQSEQTKGDGTTRAKNVAFTGLTLPRQAVNNVPIGSLVFEPQAGGQHRVLLRTPSDRTFEVLPTRKSSGATGPRSRVADSRIVNRNGTWGRIELVQFFKAEQRGQRTSLYAAYGEDNLVAAPGPKQTLTHIINITTRRVMSIPYSFISIWNGNGTRDAYVLVEPLKANGKPDVGKVLGIPVHLLKQDFAGTLADPSKWVAKVGSR
ncbi:MAG: hypothetical protein IPL79_03480 [Myxococcales bacterium]|nr:hypothetical protein [Myxococcales bacterium]